MRASALQRSRRLQTVLHGSTVNGSTVVTTPPLYPGEQVPGLVQDMAAMALPMLDLQQAAMMESPSLTLSLYRGVASDYARCIASPSAGAGAASSGASLCCFMLWARGNATLNTSLPHVCLPSLWGSGVADSMPFESYVTTYNHDTNPHVLRPATNTTPSQQMIATTDAIAYQVASVTSPVAALPCDSSSRTIVWLPMVKTTCTSDAACGAPANGTWSSGNTCVNGACSCPLGPPWTGADCRQVRARRGPPNDRGPSVPIHRFSSLLQIASRLRVGSHALRRTAPCVHTAPVFTPLPRLPACRCTRAAGWMPRRACGVPTAAPCNPRSRTITMWRANAAPTSPRGSGASPLPTLPRAPRELPRKTRAAQPPRRSTPAPSGACVRPCSS